MRAGRTVGTLVKAVAVVITMALVGGCAEPSRVEAPAQSAAAIHNGTIDTDPAHLAIVALEGGLGRCSGTLFAPRFVITATHCVDGAADKVGFGNAYTGATKWVPVDAVMTVRPNAEWAHGSDMAVLRLGRGAPMPVTPIPVLPASMGLRATDIQTLVNIVGFGVDENGDSGVKRQTNAPLSQVCVGTCLSSVKNTAAISTAGGFADHGDSGGPWIIEREGRKYVSVVTTYSNAGTVVDAYEAQRLAFMVGAAGQPCALATECTSGVCINGLCCESTCEGPCRACNLPGQEGSCRPVTTVTPCGHGGVCSRGLCCDRPCDGPCEACNLPTFEGHCRPTNESRACAVENACIAVPTCRSGTCGGEEKHCAAENECRVANGCEPATGQCRPTTPRANGTSCDVHNVCLEAGKCLGGRCYKGIPRICAPVDECHAEAVCDPRAGGCGVGEPKDGVPCAGGTCRAGVCQKPSGCSAVDDAGTPGTWLLTALSALLVVARRRVASTVSEDQDL